MDIISPIMNIYKMVDKMKVNEQQCPHVVERLKALEKLMVFIDQKMPDQLSDDVKEALEKLGTTVSSAAELIKKFTEAHKVNQMVKAGDFKLEFDKLNQNLTDAFVTLSAALHMHQDAMMEEQRMKLAKQERRLEEQEDKITEQEEILQRVESKLARENKAYYCVVQ